MSAEILAPAQVLNERRRKKWLDPDFQRRYAILLLSLVLVVSSIMLGSFWYHSDKVLESLKLAGVLEHHSLYSAIEQQMGAMLVSVSVVAVVFIGLVTIMAIYASHRIVGPIYAIKRSLEHLRDDQLEEAELHLRSGDEFHDVAELINSIVDKQRS